eukprot:scpid100493/ scgid24755/ 
MGAIRSSMQGSICNRTWILKLLISCSHVMALHGFPDWKFSLALNHDVLCSKVQLLKAQVYPGLLIYFYRDMQHSCRLEIYDRRDAIMENSVKPWIYCTPQSSTPTECLVQSRPRKKGGKNSQR